MASIVVEDEKVIARPIEVVREQFVDMRHHASTRVHADLEVSNVRPQNAGCRVTARRRVFGILQEDEIEVARGADGSSTLRSLAGSNTGLLITQRFEALGADRTRVRTTVEMPVRGLLALLAPLVRMGLKRDLATALEEDRFDLEERGYPAKLGR
ncbi:MAG: hypothetical protein HYS35_05740 [Betaproteobacteria bacterium]|nr:hypothetical protein [Betaproteobacteria bacterium]